MPLVRFVRGLSPAAGDALLAAAAGGLAQLEIWTASNPDGPRLVLALAALVVTVPIAWRRRAPLTVLVVVTAAELVASATSELFRTALFPGPPVIVAIYSAGRHLAGRRAVVAALVAAVMVFRVAFEEGSGGSAAMPPAMSSSA
jgi:hypothetical protein